jgi:hypothetical protein
MKKSESAAARQISKGKSHTTISERLTSRYAMLLCTKAAEGDSRFRWCTNDYYSSGQIVEHAGKYHNESWTDLDTLSFSLVPLVS